MTARGFYVVGVYEGGAVQLLTPSCGEEVATGKTYTAARRAVWWQYQPRGESSTRWYICRPDPDAPGVMLGRRALLAYPAGGPGAVTVASEAYAVRLNIGANRGALMQWAHDSAMAAIWPAAKGGAA